MRTLIINELVEVSGGITEKQMALMGAAALVGGTATAYIASAIGPLATFVGTPAAAIGFGLACTPVAPVVGTIFCGFVGGFMGYYLSSPFSIVAGLSGGGAASAFLVYQQLKNA